MTTPSLRGLAKAYTDGLIDRKTYIRERRKLIDGIVEGELELVAYVAPVAVDLSVDERERTFSDDGESTLELPRIDLEAETLPGHILEAKDVVESSPAKPRHKMLIGLFMLAIALLALVVFWILPTRTTTQSPNTPQGTLATPTETTAEQYLETLLKDKAWSSDSVDEFTTLWLATEKAERDKLANSTLMRRAATAIHRKIVDESALLEVGDKIDALATQQRLLELAVTLDIDDDRIKRHARDWRMNQISTTPPAPPTQDIPATEAVIVEPTTTASTPLAFELVKQTPQPTTAARTAVESEALSDAPEGAPRATPSLSTPVSSDSIDDPSPSLLSDEASSTTSASTEAKPAKGSGCRAALAQTRRPYCRDAVSAQAKGPVLAVLPAGEFTIGGSAAEEQPRKKITLARPFAISVFEISAKEFAQFCRATNHNCPSQPWPDENMPVVNVSRAQATSYAEWLSQASGARYRLPSEAEWEYAARAGSTSVYPFGDEILPTHARFSFRQAQNSPLANTDRSINRNQFRLYHMVGNVGEWVLDGWSPGHSERAADGSASNTESRQGVVRGGDYSAAATAIRSASRSPKPADDADQKTGFRVVREIN